MSAVLRFEEADVKDLDTRECRFCGWPESHHLAKTLECNVYMGGGTYRGLLSTYKPKESKP